MKLSSSDARCRYIAAPGTQTEGTPFGKFLSKLGVELPGGLTLELMVARGWIRPALRVSLPKAALDAWTNFPITSPMEGTCPEEHVWALNLYFDAVSGGRMHNSDKWWICDQDDEDSELAQIVRARSVDPANPAVVLSAPFRHARFDQEIRPWIDYFAYWQAFQVADYAKAMTATYALTDDLPVDQERAKQSRLECIRFNEAILSRDWAERPAAFEWLSRMRTAIGSSIMQECSGDEIEHAIRSIAADLNLSLDQMKHDVRNVLLRMWIDLNHQRTPGRPTPEPLIRLIRQEIEYGIYFIEVVGGKRVDPLDEYWEPSTTNGWEPSLIRALPREEEVARKEFPWRAEPYLAQARTGLPAVKHLDRQGLRSIVEKHWTRSRSLRRFVLAFHRLHEQLSGEDLAAEEKVIRKTERIEQFNLVIMHAERILSDEFRVRRGGRRYPDVRKLARESINHLLGRWNLLGGGFSEQAQERARALLDERAQLHELDEETGLRLVSVEEVASGSPIADYVIAAFVNFVIARNYAAHHDALDFDLVGLGRRPGRRHPGGLALESVLVAVLSTLIER